MFLAAAVYSYLVLGALYSLDNTATIHTHAILFWYGFNAALPLPHAPLRAAALWAFAAVCSILLLALSAAARTTLHSTPGWGGGGKTL